MQEVIQNTPVHGGDDEALSSLIASTLVHGGRARSEHLLAGHQKATGNSHCTFAPRLYDPAPALLFLLQEESAAGDDRERREPGGFSGILILLPSKSCCICPAHGPQLGGDPPSRQPDELWIKEKGEKKKKTQPKPKPNPTHPESVFSQLKEKQGRSGLRWRRPWLGNDGRGPPGQNQIVSTC